MGSVSESLERGLDLFRELLAEDPRLEREFAASRSEFALTEPEGEEERRLAARRHLEWFVLERPSASLGGVPVEALRESWLERADPGQRALGPAFIESLAGAFEVTQAVPAEGVWVRDLFSLGEFPVDEPEASAELQRQDLVVGRLFPVGNGVFRFSPAATCFRDAQLLAAVREDLDRMRQARRGVLRVQQIELEQLFFGSETEADVRPPVDGRARALDVLLAGGIEPARAERVLAEIEQANEQGDGSVVTEVLNELAFETELDLDAARRALATLWTELDAQQAPPAEAVLAGKDVRAALEAFDRGRAAGLDLEQLFRSLESDLGVEPSADEDEREPGGALPGVIAGLVEEFLWETSRERDPALEERWGGLRRLGQYAGDLVEFEDLGPREVIDFAGRWLLDEGELTDPAQAVEVLEALGDFCRWAEERHGHPLWTGVAAAHEGLRASVPRLLVLRTLLGEAESEGTPARRVLRIDAESVWLELPDGGESRVPLPALQLEHLQPGDFVRFSAPDLGARLTSAYPGEIEGLLRDPE